MQKLKTLLFGLILIGVLSSCLHRKRMVYIQNQNVSEQKPAQIQNPRPDYLIQTNDVLAIQVKSTQSEFNELFNNNTIGGNLLNNPGSMFLAGYSVSDSGFVTLPTVGRVMVKGLTLNQAKIAIEKGVQQYLNTVTVQVKLISFKISVLGEVKSPGYYYVYNNQATIFEGLGLAGDIGDFGNRRKIKIVRQTPTGSEVAMLDITDPNILKSKYYYLLPNDVLYVEPLKAKFARSNLQPLGVFFGGITAVAVILRFIYDVQ